MKKKKMLSRIFALLLALTVLVPNGATAFSEGVDEAEVQSTYSDGLCPHHTEHTQECGFVQGSEGSPCQHVHDGSCGYVEELKELNCQHVHDGSCGYVEELRELNCQHVHDSSCGYAQAVEEVPCNMGCTDTDGDGIIEHVEGCAFVSASEGSPCQHVHDDSCYTVIREGSPCQHVHDDSCYTVIREGSPCQHVHDDSCGYVTPVEGKPCNFSCDICGAENAEPVKVLSLDNLSSETLQQTVPVDTALESLLLPDQLTGLDENNEPISISGITWTSEPAYNGEEGSYVFSPQLPEGYILSEGMELPKISVSVLKAEGRAAVLDEVYWNFQNGDDSNDGESRDTAVKSFEKAKELLAEDGKIYVCSPVQVSGTETWSLAGKGDAVLQRNTSFKMIELLEGASLTLENITINGVMTDGSAVECEYSAIWSDSPCSLTLNSGCVIQNNSVEYMGAAICGWEGMQLTMNSGAVIQNNNTLGAHYGGGVFLANGSTFIMNGGEIKENNANRGGAIALIGSSMTMNGGSIYSNSTYDVSSDGYGGAVYISDYEAISSIPGHNAIMPGDASFTMYGGTISGNTAVADGGGILSFPQGNREPGYSRKNIAVTIAGGTISNNTAQNGNGGGIDLYYPESSLEIGDGSLITGNRAEAGNGGGIFLAAVADAAISGGVISNNSAESGAGVYIGSLYENGYQGSQLQLSGNGEIKENTASSYGGGAYIDIKSTLLMSGGAITSNIAQDQGGGLYLTSPTGSSKVTAKITGGTISGNHAMGHMKYKASDSSWQEYANTFSNGISLSSDATLQFGGTAVIDQQDDISIYSTTWSPTYGSYIQVISTDWSNGGGKVSVTSQSADTPKYIIEHPETDDEGSRLVSYNDEFEAVGSEHSLAANAADLAGLFVPSAAMLEAEPTLAIGQSKIDGRTNIMTYVAPFATIAPANVTIYVGGNGYTGVVDEGGQDTGSANGFPVPGFTISGISDFDATKAVLKYEDTEGNILQWSIGAYDGNENAAHGIYSFKPEGAGANVRMQFEKTDAEGKGTGEFVDQDAFIISDHLDQDLIMEVYGEGVDANYVTLEYDGVSYMVRVGTGMLKVRSTSQDVHYGNLGDALENGEPGLKAPDETEYYINGKPVQVTDTSGIALLFDDIIEENGTQRPNTDLIIQRSNQELAASAGDLEYELKYLDLVDRNNGNVWVAASNPVTVYWPLPAGTTKDTEFKLLHFKGMNREMGVDEVRDDILGEDTVVEDLTDMLTVTEEYITFDVGTGGFSPFALAWPAQATGDITVSKTVSGTAGETDRSFNFTVKLDDASLSGVYGAMEFKNGEAVFTLKHGESKTAQGLPEGVGYTVTEAEANLDGYSTASTGAAGTIAAGVESKAEFTNKRDAAPAPGTGGLSVTKTVKGNAGSTSKYFSFTVILDDRSINGVYEQMDFKDGVASFSLKHGESRTAGSLPEGIGYQVYEAEANRNGYSTVAVNSSGTITAGTTARAEFINTRNYAYGGFIPHTGDSSELGLWMTLGGVSLLAMAGVGVFLRLKRRKGETE